MLAERRASGSSFQGHRDTGLSREKRGTEGRWGVGGWSGRAMKEGRDGRKGDEKEEEKTEEEEKGGRQLTACSSLCTAIPALANYFH